MKKFLVFILFLFFTVPSAFAQNTDSNLSQNDDLQKVNSLLSDYLKYSNQHDLDKLSKLYADNYFSADGFNKQQLISLMKDTWVNYPTILYSTCVKDIRINDNLASVESYDKAVGETTNKSDITNDTGNLESNSHNIVYIQRFGKKWKIISDRVDFEKTIIKYGSAKKINLDFYAPEQVNAGDNYTGTLQVDLPKNVICLGSITREPIVYPQAKTDEVFRQVFPDFNTLERVMRANITNNNELASASAGFTEIIDNKNESADIKLTGIAIIMQRVNVIPKSSYAPAPSNVKEPKKAALQENSANNGVNKSK